MNEARSELGRPPDGDVESSGESENLRSSSGWRSNPHELNRGAGCARPLRSGCDNDFGGSGGGDSNEAHHLNENLRLEDIGEVGEIESGIGASERINCKLSSLTDNKRHKRTRAKSISQQSNQEVGAQSARSRAEKSTIRANLSERERSSSITSDYFSSSHNSPIVIKRNQHQTEKSDREIGSPSRLNRSRTIRIYENPAFARNVSLPEENLTPKKMPRRRTIISDEAPKGSIIGEALKVATKIDTEVGRAKTSVSLANSNYLVDRETPTASSASDDSSHNLVAVPSSSSSSSSSSSTDLKQISSCDSEQSNQRALNNRDSCRLQSADRASSAKLAKTPLLLSSQLSSEQHQTIDLNSRLADLAEGENINSGSNIPANNLFHRQSSSFANNQETKSDQLVGQQTAGSDYCSSPNAARQLAPVPVGGSRPSARERNLRRGQEKSSHYYYYSPDALRGQTMLSDSQTSSQRTNEICDESPSRNNTNESTHLHQHQTASTNHYANQRQIQQRLGGNHLNDSHHYYQVVAPEQHRAARWQPQFGMENLNQPTSPCKNIQRMVSSLFSANPNQLNEQHHFQLPPIPTINQNLVVSEPLIRSSSWHNKTLIDLRQQQQKSAAIANNVNANPAGVHYLESSLIQKTLPNGSRYSQFCPCPIQPDAETANSEHLYCGLSTLYRSASQQQQQKQKQQLEAVDNPKLAFYKAEGLDQSFHTLVDKMNERHFYQVQSPVPQFGQQIGQMIGSSGGGSSTSSALAKPNSVLTSCCLAKRVTKLCLLVLLLVASCLGLIASLAKQNYSQFQGPTQAAEDKAPTQSDNLERELLAMQTIRAGKFGPNTLSEYAQLNHHNLQRLPLEPHPTLPSLPPLMSGRTPPVGRPPLTAPQGIPQTPSPAITTTISTTNKPQASTEAYEASTQSYWLLPASFNAEKAASTCLLDSYSECNLKGVCNDGACLCYKGFSGPTCATDNCPNKCSQRGECQLRPDFALNGLGDNRDLWQTDKQLAHLKSVGFQTLSVAKSRDSVCPGKLESASSNNSWLMLDSGSNSQTNVHDNRVGWSCSCEPGFAGADCSQLQELNCSDNLDNDNDGLIDCEDDDCCTQLACRENLLCFKSPEPTKVLEMAQSRSSALDMSNHPVVTNYRESFFAQVKFLIANDSVQSYAPEMSFDKKRVAVVRGRVVNAAKLSGIVSVRVGVVENTVEFGFTFSRSDGLFDFLVNGDEWITLHFYRNAHFPVKRKIFVRAHSINQLDEDVEMLVATESSNGNGNANNNNNNNNQLQQQQGEPRRFDSSFDLQFSAEILKLISTTKRDDERRRNQLFECLLVSLHQKSRRSFDNQHEPSLVLETNNHLKTFVLANSGSFQAQLEGDKYIQPIYNSAAFSPAASVTKPTIAIRLLSNQQLSPKLSSIILQLDIEGQARRERLTPLPGLLYRFAWNRRNVYDQKVFGFGELNIRIGYEYNLGEPSNQSNAAAEWTRCLEANAMEFPSDSAATDKFRPNILTNPNFNKQVVWFEQRIYLEAHQLNQHADIGKWNLAVANRLDQEREIIYFGSGWSLPYKLIYPPVISDPISLKLEDQSDKFHGDGIPPFDHTIGRLMAKGPHLTMFVLIPPHKSANQFSSGRLIQIERSAKRRLLDVPLSIFTSKLGLSPASSFDGAENLLSKLAIDDLQLVYNSYLSTLYLSSQMAGKIVQVSYSSLLVLNKTLAGGSATAAAEDEIDIEPLCGFGRQILSSSSPADSIRPVRQVRLIGPHSLALDEARQVLYFIDGNSELMGIDLSTRQVGLLPVLSRFGPAKSSQTSFKDRRCEQSDLQLSFVDYKPHRMHSLVWSKADSSLYFIDQNSIFSLRQDFILQLIAIGFSSPRQNNLPISCFTGSRTKLGLIKSLTIDELNHDLLVVHQWTNLPAEMTQSQDKEKSKISGRFYFAKLKLGIESLSLAHKNSNSIRKIIDLHSAGSTWDPMIAQIAGKGNFMTVAKSFPDINWDELANPNPNSAQKPASSNGQSVRSERLKRIGFIHLSGGFERLDSVEPNSDGSIFVLDSSRHSIKLIESYSPYDFNQVERRDVNINRLFASAQQQQLDIEPIGIESERKLATLTLRNPISEELMEFHLGSGLQLSLSLPNKNAKLHFYYQIFNNTKNLQMDEDDKLDLEVQRLVGQAKGAYIRLSRIIDSVTRSEYDLVRVYTGSRFVLQSILRNHQPVCELATDYAGVLNSYQQPGKDYWVELVYEGLTYLLHDIITKTESPQVSQSNNSQKPSSDWTQLKRIVYDKVFYQYCDLFFVQP